MDFLRAMKRVPKRNECAHARGTLPVVISDMRYQGIVSRAFDLDNEVDKEEARQERMYHEYLDNGNMALVHKFTGGIIPTKEENLAKVKKRREEEMERRNAIPRLRGNIDEPEQLRRACFILDRKKQGPIMVEKAMLQSDTLWQREQQKALKATIAIDEAIRNYYEDKYPQEVRIIPQAEDPATKIGARRKKDIEFQRELLQDMQRRETRRQYFKDQSVIDGIAEREQAKCLLAAEQKAQKERIARKKAAARAAYFDALNEKDRLERRNNLKQSFTDRIDCAYATAERELAKSSVKRTAERNAKKIEFREKRANRLHKRAVKAARAEEKKFEALCQNYDDEIEMDTMHRQCMLEQRNHDRRQICNEEMLAAQKRKAVQFEVDRFDVAARIKNAEVNKRFEAAHKQKQLAEREVKRKQRQQQLHEFRENRRNYILQQNASAYDTTNLMDDKAFFKYALSRANELKDAGQSLAPIFRATEAYKRTVGYDRIVKLAKRPIVTRNRMWDTAEPGYIERADLKWKIRINNQMADAANRKDFDKMLNSCLQIDQLELVENAKKIASECLHLQQQKTEKLKAMAESMRNAHKPGKQFLSPTSFQACAAAPIDAVGATKLSVCELLPSIKSDELQKYYNATTLAKPRLTQYDSGDVSRQSSVVKQSVDAQPVEPPKPRPSSKEPYFVVKPLKFTEDYFVTPKVGAKLLPAVDVMPLQDACSTRISNVSSVQLGGEGAERSGANE